MARNPAPSDPGTRMFLRIFFWLIQWLVVLKALFFTPKNDSGEKGFARLVSWGQKSGMPRPLNQTPAEYGQRLGKQFHVFLILNLSIIE